VSIARTPLRLLAACAALALLPACDGGGGGTTDVPIPLAVSASGRLERGSVLTVSVSDGSRVLGAGEVTLSFSPADAAQLQGDGSVKLLKAGHLTITAAAGGRSGSAGVDVAAPPVVVFDRQVGGNRDIWRVDLDGQNLTQLTTDPGDDQDPTAVKGTVVFVSYRGGNGDLYSIPLGGGATTRLTTTARDESTPSLSLDGTKLAFSYVPTDVTKVFTSAANGTGAAQLVPGTGADVIETAPTWSPSGAVAYVSTAAGSADIVQATIGGSPTTLTGSPQADVEPAWSADGQTLAFVSNRGGSVEIWLRSSASGAVTQLTSGAGSRFNPAWTADGRVVYVEQVGGTTQLRWIDPANPAVSTAIDVGGGTVGHPAANIP
jgi:TolB protein